MAISYPLTPPASPGFQSLKMIATKVAARSASPYTGSQQIYEWPGEWWEIQAALPPMTRLQAEAWLSFLLALRGSVGTFLIGDPAAKAVQGNAGGSLVCSGAATVGAKTLNISGLTGTLKAGDYLQVAATPNSQLFKNLTDAGPGAVTLDVFPAVRTAFANNTPISLANCLGNFRLKDNSLQWTVDKMKMYGLSFDAVEAF